MATVEVILPHDDPKNVREEQRKDDHLKAIIDSFESTRFTNVGYLMHPISSTITTMLRRQDIIVQREHWLVSCPDTIDQGLQNTLKKFIDCQRYKATNTKPAGLFQSAASHQRFEVIAIDLFGSLPKTETGHTTIFIIEDITSRWVELFALQDATAEVCGNILLNEVFLGFGLPRKIISDNGPQFVSAIMQTLTFCLDIKQTLTPVYHPEANQS